MKNYKLRIMYLEEKLQLIISVANWSFSQKCVDKQKAFDISRELSYFELLRIVPELS